MTLNYYRIKSRGWHFGYVLARSSLHAVLVATDTGLHRRGKRIEAWTVCMDSAPEQVQALAAAGHVGRVLSPHPFRKYFLLIHTTDELVN
jgi:hypothetical protein